MRRMAPQLSALAALAVWFVASSATAQPIGGIDFPTEGQTVGGIVRVSGFVLDFNSVDRVELLVDDVLVNRADTDLPRPDVLEIFPTYYNSGSVLYRFTNDSNLRLFVGQQRGGLRCVSGVCRVFPAFEGARAELTLRF